jgi:signal transduction histidine kinase
VSFSDDDLALLTFVGDHAAAALARRQSDDALRAAHASLSAGAVALQAKNEELEKTLSDLHAAQNELMRREKLASLGALVAGIAHEVNTPLGVCVTAVSFLVDENRAVRERLDADTLPAPAFRAHVEAAGDLLGLVNSNVQRASDLIRSFRQVAVDSASDDIREFPLAVCIEETLRMLKPRFADTRHTVEVACEPDLRVRSAPNAISQILSHLIVNALVHAFEHRDAGHIRIAARRDGPQLALDIRDDGAGMPPGALAHLFDPFYTTKRGQGRTGLGANIVYNLVTTKLGGTIAAESVAGEGLAYRIRVPA